MKKKIGGFFVQQIRRELSLTRFPINPDSQTRKDRLSLTLSGWAHFYFNYRFAPRFEVYLDELASIIDSEEFRHRLLEFFELHYLSALMSFNTIAFSKSDIQKAHFSEMQDGFLTLAEATGDSPSAIIDNALHTMLYHDLTYTWCTQPIFGSMNCYYSAKSLLYKVKGRLN